MHIVMFVDYPESSLGGVQTSVRAQRKALEKAGHLVTMVTPSTVRPMTADANTIIVPGLPYSPYEYRLSLPSRRLERKIESELAKRPKIDVVHVQTNMGVAIMGIHIAKRLKRPLVQTMHTRDDVFMQKTIKFPGLVTPPSWYIYKAALGLPVTKIHRLDESWSVHNSWRVMVHHAQQADMVTTPSEHFARRLREHGVSKPVVAISNGLDDDMLEDFWRDQEVPGAFKLPLKIAWVGRLSAEKRPLVCLEAIKDIPKAEIDFYGEGQDESTLRRYISEHGLEKRARLNGRLSQADVMKAVSKHDVFIQSSYNFDTQSMVLLESIAVGVPVVLSDPDLTEGLPLGAAIITEKADAKSLRTTLTNLLALPEKLTEMKAVAWENRRAVLQSKMTSQMLQVYQDAIDYRLNDSSNQAASLVN